MEKVKKAIVYIWIFGLLIAMYSAEAWSYTYLRQYGSEHPKENLIFAILILAFLIPFAIILIVNKFKNKDKPKQKVELTWSGLATTFIICGGHDFLQNRAMKIVNATRAAPTVVNIENAKTDIITLYAVYFISLTVFCIVADFFEKKYKQNKIDTEETAG